MFLRTYGTENWHQNGIGATSARSCSHGGKFADLQTHCQYKRDRSGHANAVRKHEGDQGLSNAIDKDAASKAKGGTKAQRMYGDQELGTRKIKLPCMLKQKQCTNVLMNAKFKRNTARAHEHSSPALHSPET